MTTTTTAKNVRLGKAERVHAVVPNRYGMRLPACGAGLGQYQRRTLTSDEVSCPDCKRIA